MANEDTSIVTIDSPNGARPSRTQLKWTNNMEMAFIAAMKSMQCRPTKSAPSGFTKDAYKRVAEIMKDKSMQPELCDEVRMKNKLGALRNDWRSYVGLLNSGWDRLPNGVPVNTDEVMEAYYREKDPNARKFKTSPVKFFTELTDLFDPKRTEWIDLATGDFARDVSEILSTSRPSPSTRPSQLGSVQADSAQLPHSPYEPTVPPQTQDTPSHQPRAQEDSHASTSSKRPADNDLSNQAKRPNYDINAQTLDVLRRQSLNRSPQLSPVANATALFTKTFQSLPVKVRVAVVQRFTDQNLAEIFLHTDAEVRAALVDSWARQAEPAVSYEYINHLKSGPPSA